MACISCLFSEAAEIGVKCPAIDATRSAHELAQAADFACGCDLNETEPRHETLRVNTIELVALGRRNDYVPAADFGVGCTNDVDWRKRAVYH
jgi:hypothetical protein